MQERLTGVVYCSPCSVVDPYLVSVSKDYANRTIAVLLAGTAP